MAGRGAKFKETPGRRGRSAHDEGSESELQSTRVTQLEMEVKGNVSRMQVMEKELKEIKTMIKDLTDTKNRDGAEGMMEGVEHINKQMEELREEIVGLRQTNDSVTNENKMLKQKMQKIVEENCKLKKRLDDSDERVTEQRDDLVKLKQDQEGWMKVQKDKVVDFGEIMKQQREEQRNNLEKEVVQVLKKKENMVRDIVEKKQCVVVFGLEERVLPYKTEREREELRLAKDVVQAVQDPDTGLEKEIEVVYRLGKYEVGKVRPLKIRFTNQIAAMKVLDRTKNLAEVEEYKKVWIRADLNEEERAARNELIKEAKEKNGQRSEAEKNTFFWRVLDGRIKKWYVKGEQTK